MTGLPLAEKISHWSAFPPWPDVVQLLRHTLPPNTSEHIAYVIVPNSLHWLWAIECTQYLRASVEITRKRHLLPLRLDWPCLQPPPWCRHLWNRWLLKESQWFEPDMYQSYLFRWLLQSNLPCWLPTTFVSRQFTKWIELNCLYIKGFTATTFSFGIGIMKSKFAGQFIFFPIHPCSNHIKKSHRFNKDFDSMNFHGSTIFRFFKGIIQCVRQSIATAW